jgi:hypothetical protein
MVADYPPDGLVNAAPLEDALIHARAGASPVVIGVIGTNQWY